MTRSLTKSKEGFDWTKEQLHLFDTALDPNVNFLKVEAVAGASKSSSLIEVAERFGPSSKQLYLTFSKAMADESSTKFPSNTECSTIHSLAYKYTVRQYGLDVGFFNARDLRGKLNYGERKVIIKHLEEFLLSGYTDSESYFATTNAKQYVIDSVDEHLDLMAAGVIKCTHSFYLKFFHIMLELGEIKVPKYDLLMIDEAGDLTNLTIEVFKLLSANTKILTGDRYQTIMTFMFCTNAFDYFKDVGTTVNLTQSFRVSEPLAKKVESFMRTNVDKEFVFRGFKYSKVTNNSTMYIARTNGSLVAEMLRNMDKGKAFKTTRKIDTILELPLVLANLDNGEPIKVHQYKLLEKYRNSWNTNPYIKANHESLLEYIKAELKYDEEIVRGVNVVLKNNAARLLKLKAFVDKNLNTPTTLVCTSCHSSKGLEADTVVLAPDVDTTVDRALRWQISGTPKQKAEAETELKLYYVAITRARHTLKGTDLLKEKTGLAGWRL